MRVWWFSEAFVRFHTAGFFLWSLVLSARERISSRRASGLTVFETRASSVGLIELCGVSNIWFRVFVV